MRTLVHFVKRIENINNKTPASDILRRFRPFVGPSHPKKFKHKPLPLVRDEEGRVCTHPNEAPGVWVRFFQDMECGCRMSFQDLRNQCIAELMTFRNDELQQDLHELPSLTDLEFALDVCLVDALVDQTAFRENFVIISRSSLRSTCTRSSSKSCCTVKNHWGTKVAV